MIQECLTETANISRAGKVEDSNRGQKCTETSGETPAGSGNGINDFRDHLRKNNKHYPAYSIEADKSTDVNTRQLAVFIHGCIHIFFFVTKLKSHVTGVDIFCELGNLPKLGVRISTYQSCLHYHRSVSSYDGDSKRPVGRMNEK